MDPNETRTDWASLVDLLRCRAAATNPTRICLRFLPDGEDGAAVTCTRGELDRRARALAARLQDLGWTGERALLLYPPGLDFIAAFFGCLYAGVVAVPAHLPRLNRPMTRLRSIVDDAAPCAVLTSITPGEGRGAVVGRRAGTRGRPGAVLRSSTRDGRRAGRPVGRPGRTSGTLAFLQYTSGSTAAPKGVMITHGNLL